MAIIIQDARIITGCSIVIYGGQCRRILTAPRAMCGACTVTAPSTTTMRAPARRLSLI